MANIDLATPPSGTPPTLIQASGIRTSLGLGALATGSSVLASQISNATSPGIALLTGADAASQRTSLGLGTLATGSPSGTANSTTYLRGDLSWATVAGGSSDPIPLVSSFYY